MRSDRYTRASLQVAPLSLQQSNYNRYPSSADHGTATATSSNPYAHKEMTPPATPTGFQGDIIDQIDPPPVFHNFLRAFYPFHPSYGRTDSTVTLPLDEGDVILVHSIHTNGWADGTLLASGARGWLPTNYCEAYNAEEVRTLLKALLNFWDLLRSTTINDVEIFGNQEFMKGIIAGVRYLLERSNCLTRESATIQRHEGLRRGRKSILSELSLLVKSAKRLQGYQRIESSPDDVNDIVDEMILKAFKIVIKGVRFLDLLEDDRRQRAPAVTVMATVVEETAVPPTPPADATSFQPHEGQIDPATHTDASEVGPNTSEGTQASTAPQDQQRLTVSCSNNTHRVSQSHLLPANRSSANMAHRVSLAGPSPLSRPQNLVLHRLSTSHDTFLSHFGSFIGRLHSHSQCRAHLALAIKQSATSGGQLLIVIDVVCAHNTVSKELLEDVRANMYDRIVDLVHVAHHILTSGGDPDAVDVMLPQDCTQLLWAATDCVKATGECVAKAKWVIEKVGDFEVEFDERQILAGLDLSPLELRSLATTGGKAGSVSTTESPRASIAGSADSSSAVSDAPTFTTSTVKSATTNTTTATTTAAKSSKPAVDKPLPSVPQSEPPAEHHAKNCAGASRPSSLVANESNTSFPASLSHTRPTLPPLPKLSTALMSDDEDSPSDQSATQESEVHTSFRSDSMTASSSGTTNTYISRDSELSLVSQISTRATTPDTTTAPRTQPSISELSNAGSNSAAEEVEEVEDKLLEKTFAHELMFNKEGQVTGGSLRALVERLTTHESTPDAVFVSTFYLTFRLFCTPRALAEALISRFDYIGEAPHIAGPVRLRAYNVFKGWLESHWREEADHDALPLIEAFANFTLSLTLPSAGRRLLELTQRVSSTDRPLVPRLISSMGKTNTSFSQPSTVDAPLPASNMTKAHTHALSNWKKGGTCPTILDFDPLEVARQVTLKQMSIFCSIMPDELLGSKWMKNRGIGSPNVKTMTAFSTDLSNLVADTILCFPEPKKRAAVMKQWIKVAQHCFELHNYDALMAILCSLNSSTITRLRRTWDIVSLKRREMLKFLQTVVDPAQNYKTLRTHLHERLPPCLPFLGMFLTDLAFVDVGNPPTKQLPGHDGSDDAGLTVINFDKHSRTAKIIGELQRFQIPYQLLEVSDLQDWIQGQMTRVRELETPGNSAQIKYYRKSLLLEPREAQVLKTPIDAAAPISARDGVSRADLFGWMRSNTTNNNSTSA